MLIEHDLFRGRIDRVQIAIDRLKMFEPEEGYYHAYSDELLEVVQKNDNVVEFKKDATEEE